MWKVSERKNRNRNMKVNQELKLGKKTRVKTKASAVLGNVGAKKTHTPLPLPWLEHR
jgi:hypothetical protein